nr:hypothetical protein [Tanacetum cinerariifolium]
MKAVVLRREQEAAGGGGCCGVLNTIVKENLEEKESAWQVRRTLKVAVIMDDHAEGEKSKEGQMDENANPTTTQGEHYNVEENAAILVTSQGKHKSDNANISSTNEETTLVIHQTANLKTIKDDTDYDELDKNPLSKMFKILTLIPNFPTPTPLCSIPPEHMMKIAPHQEAQEEESKKFLNPATVKAQVLKWEEHEEKKAKLVNEYYKCIKGRTDPFPITKISYIINSQKEPTIRITIVLATFGMTAEDKKRKRNEILKEVFFKERIDVDGTQRNITPPSGVVCKEGMVIRETEAGFFYFNANFDLVFQRESKCHLTSTVQLIRLLNRINLDSLEAREM